MSADTVTLSSPALECEGRVCLQMGTAAAVCTAECGNDDDCRNIAPSGAGNCHQGFVCVVPAAVGDYACQRFCVCRDTPPAAVSCPAES